MAPAAALDQLRKDYANGAAQHGSGNTVHRGRLCVQNDHPGSSRLRQEHGIGHRVNVETGADGKQQIGLFGSCMARSMTSGTSGWPKEMVALLRMPPQLWQAGSSSPARTRACALLGLVT